MGFLNFIKNLLKGGVKIGYSTGKTFDPHDQERTDAMDDLIKQNRKKENKKNGTT